MKKGKRSLCALLSLLLAVMMLAACGQQAAPSSAAPAPVSSAPPASVAEPEPAPSEAEPEPEPPPAAENRVVCLAPSMVEVVYALGQGDSIVGWSRYTDYPPEVEEREGWIPYGDYVFESAEAELAKDVAVVSDFSTYDAELVAALEPTLVLAESSMQHTMYEELLAAGYNVRFYSPITLDEVFDMILDVGDALGVPDVASALVDGYNADIAEIQAITAELPKVRVYLEIAHRTEYDGETFGPYATGSGSPFDQMLEIAGGENVFANLEGDYAAVEYEDIVAANPDVILSPMWPDAMEGEVTTLAEIYSREGFENIEAVQNSRVYFYDSSLLKRFGPRSVTAIKKIAYLLHPYYFENPPDSVSPWELGRIDETYDPPKSLH